MNKMNELRHCDKVVTQDNGEKKRRRRKRAVLFKKKKKKKNGMGIEHKANDGVSKLVVHKRWRHY